MSACRSDAAHHAVPRYARFVTALSANGYCERFILYPILEHRGTTAAQAPRQVLIERGPLPVARRVEGGGRFGSGCHVAHYFPGLVTVLEHWPCVIQ